MELRGLVWVKNDRWLIICDNYDNLALEEDGNSNPEGKPDETGGRP